MERGEEGGETEQDAEEEWEPRRPRFQILERCLSLGDNADWYGG